jgi:hypothetical protein
MRLNCPACFRDRGAGLKHEMYFVVFKSQDDNMCVTLQDKWRKTLHAIWRTSSLGARPRFPA